MAVILADLFKDAVVTDHNGYYHVMARSTPEMVAFLGTVDREASPVDPYRSDDKICTFGISRHGLAQSQLPEMQQLRAFIALNPPALAGLPTGQKLEF